MSLEGRHALVTGGGTGIGAAIAAALAARGARVTIMGRRREPMEKTSGAIGEVLVVQADVTDEAAAMAAIGTAADERGPVEILVNNAGSAETAAFAKMPADMLRRMLAVHVEGASHCMRAVLPAMVEAGFGRIVNIASTAGLKGYGYCAAYCAAKHALIGLTRVLAIELARTGVTVNALCPGFTDTGFLRASIVEIAERTGRPEEEILKELLRDNPMGRLIRPQEVADAVVWLAGDAAAAVTGAAIPIAGGEAG